MYDSTDKVSLIWMKARIHLRTTIFQVICSRGMRIRIPAPWETLSFKKTSNFWYKRWKSLALRWCNLSHRLSWLVRDKLSSSWVHSDGWSSWSFQTGPFCWWKRACSLGPIRVDSCQKIPFWHIIRVRTCHKDFCWWLGPSFYLSSYFFFSFSSLPSELIPVEGLLFSL